MIRQEATGTNALLLGFNLASPFPLSLGIRYNSQVGTKSDIDSRWPHHPLG
jgi:hypothetical protein